MMHTKSLILANLASDSRIVTADQFMKQMQLCLAGDREACEMISKDWDLRLKEAENLLTYTWPAGDGEYLGKTLADKFDKSVSGALSTDSILDFEAIITTTRKDRDGDVLETGGADLDPNCALLLFHDMTLPVGKLLSKLQHTKDLMSGRFCIFDTALGRDARTLVRGGALRISHGFEPTELEPLKGVEDGRWHITKLKIFEVSLVTVPSNIDAVITSWQKGLLESPIMKAYGKSIHDNRPVIGIGFEAPKTMTKSECSCHQQKTGKLMVDKAGLTQPKQDEDEEDPIRWNRRLSKNFDVRQEHLQASMLEYEWVSRFLQCHIKDVFQNGVTIPSPRMGTWLTGLRNILSAKQAVAEDTRNITEYGKEAPCQYEVIELNSKQSDDFLIDGIVFYKSPEGSFVINLTPVWYGLRVTLYTTVAQKTLNRDVIDKTYAWAKENNFLKGEAFSLSGEFLARTTETFEDVFLTEVNEKPIRQMLTQLNKKQLKCPNRGMVFMGPPGTGKTLSGRIIKNDANASFIWVSTRDFWRMGSCGGMSYAFEMAKEIAPSVIFFEDIDSWIDSGTIDFLKSEMDGIGRSSGVITVLTTNFPELLPKALLDRPGRFHDVLKFDLPTEKERNRMLSKWLEGITADELKQAVEKTAGFSGAHLYELAAYAKTISEQDEEPLGPSVFKALAKIEEQRELINEAQLAGSRFKPRRDFNSSKKGFDMSDKKDNNDAEFPTQGETQDKPGDLEQFGGQKPQQGDTGFVPQESSGDTGGQVSPTGVGKDVAPPVVAETELTVKGGRTISAKNRDKLNDAKDHLDMVLEMDAKKISSQAKTLCKAAQAHIAEIIAEPDDEDDKGIPESVGFELDPAQYDISKCAAIVLMKLHEVNVELLWQLAGEIESHLLQAANEKTVVSV